MLLDVGSELIPQRPMLTFGMIVLGKICNIRDAVCGSPNAIPFSNFHTSRCPSRPVRVKRVSRKFYCRGKITEI